MIRGGKAYRQHPEVKAFVLDRDNRACRLCGRTEADGAILEVDHVIPWAESHDSSLSNLRCLCLQCNRDTRRPRSDRALPVAEYNEWIRRELAACGVAPVSRLSAWCRRRH